MDNIHVMKSVIYQSCLVVGILCSMGDIDYGGAHHESCFITQNTNLSDITSSHWMFAEKHLRTAFSAVQCGVLCLMDFRCISFMVNIDTGLCRLHAVRLTDKSDSLLAPGFRYYDTCRAPRFIGDLCNNSIECALNYTECLEGTCQCQAGYGYWPPGRECMSECPEYGPEFVGFDQYFITLNNDATLSDSAYLTQAGCQHACDVMTNFTCRSLDLSPTGCYLSKATKFTNPDDYYFANHHTVIHYQRQCSYN